IIGIYRCYPKFCAPNKSIMRTVKQRSISLTETLRKQLLNWAKQFDEVVWLDSNDHSQKYGSLQAVLAVDAFTAISTDSLNAFDKLKEYQTTTKDWIFGYLSYDLKNDVENLVSANFDGLNFPDIYFFQPKKIFLFSENTVEMHYLNSVADEIEADWVSISQSVLPFEALRTSIPINTRTQRDDYLYTV